MKQSRFVCACFALMTGWVAPAAAADVAQAITPTAPPARPESTTVTVVQPNDVPVPRVLPPCVPGRCLFPGQKVTVIATKSAISVAIRPAGATAARAWGWRSAGIWCT